MNEECPAGERAVYRLSPKKQAKPFVATGHRPVVAARLGHAAPRATTDAYRAYSIKM